MFCSLSHLIYIYLISLLHISNHQSTIQSQERDLLLDPICQRHEILQIYNWWDLTTYHSIEHRKSLKLLLYTWLRPKIFVLYRRLQLTVGFVHSHISTECLCQKVSQINLLHNRKKCHQHQVHLYLRPHIHLNLKFSRKVLNVVFALAHHSKTDLPSDVHRLTIKAYLESLLCWNS